MIKTLKQIQEDTNPLKDWKKLTIEQQILVLIASAEVIKVLKEFELLEEE